MSALSATPDSRKKTITMTFRLDENVLNTLRIEADHHHTSLNTLVNQILQRYVEWDIYEPKIGFISLSRPVAAELFNRVSKQEIIHLAEQIGKNAINDAALFMRAKMDINSFLSWLELRMETSSVDISHNIEGHVHTYTLKHDLGENYSLYQKTVLELIFRDIFSKNIDCRISDTMISFRFSN